MHTLTCRGCGFRYGEDGWIEAVIPDDIWVRISPTGDEGGILCIVCMGAALDAIGLSDVPVKLTAGPFKLVERQ